LSKRRGIGVLAGGDSPEREVSLVSGPHVHEALLRAGHVALLIEIQTLDDLVPRLQDVDVVFNCLHGGSGEDGTVQLLLDVFGIPYAGSGSQACARAMDKSKARSLIASQEIPIARGLSYDGGDLEAFIERAATSIPSPWVAKPTNGGSTIAVSFVETAERLLSEAKAILKRFPSVLIEEYIDGREITVGILEAEGTEITLPVIEIEIPGRLFDYKAKYSEGVAEFVVPAPLDEAVARRAQDVSLRAHRALGCTGFSRVDLRLANNGTPYVLEVNTLPGMTPMSDLPRAAAAIGIDYGRLVEIMLESASKGGE